MSFKPVQVAIMDLIEIRLKKLKSSNGFTFNIHDDLIKREEISNFTGKELPALFYWPSADVKVARKTTHEQRSLNVVIAAFFRCNEKNPSDQAFLVAAEIYTVLNRHPDNPSSNEQVILDLDDSVVDSKEFESITPITGQGQTPFAGVIIDLSVGYPIKKGQILIEI